MKRYRLDPRKPRQLSPAETHRLEAAPIEHSDIPLGDEFFTKARAAWPPTKQQLTTRLDADVLAWLKSNGRGYQTRINRILRAAMESPPVRRSRSAAAPGRARECRADESRRNLAHVRPAGRVGQVDAEKKSTAEV
jgi:uncharacterized protein (DUF4415 family)